MTFKELHIIEPILEALEQEGYKTPTPIQQKAIPAILNGNDIYACAQTGTGKTAAFALPIIQKVLQGIKPGRGKAVKTLILTPTRELAVQIGECFDTYGAYTQLEHCVIFGGIAQKYQIERIKTGVDIIIATPGRLLDLVNQKLIILKSIEFVVLDEADRMLDMGFAQDVRSICSMIPAKRQTMLFSATLPKEVESLAGSILRSPVKIEINPSSSTADKIEQSLYYVEKQNKINLLVSLLKDGSQESVMVFTRTKHGADKVARALSSSNIPAEAIHGNKSQFARQTTLNNFKDGKIRVLVATDVAARGIDVEGLTHVVNFDLPEIAETYVHRIGRTGRAGMSGTALSFVDSEQSNLVKYIERLIGKQISVITGHRYEETGNKPATHEAGEMTGEDYRRQKRANQLGIPSDKRRAPQGRPQHSTYSRTKGEVKSRPSNEIYGKSSYQVDFTDFTDFDDLDDFGKPKKNASYQEPTRKESNFSHFAKPGARKSFNPNFNNQNKSGRSTTSRRKK